LEADRYVYIEVVSTGKITKNALQCIQLSPVEQMMTDSIQPVTIVYWRDIPAQVIVGKGRRGAKVQLSERFEQAIDRAAMKAGARDTDSYLAEWRKAAPYDVAGEPAEVAAAQAARLEATYDSARLKALIANDGRDAGP